MDESMKSDVNDEELKGDGVFEEMNKDDVAEITEIFNVGVDLAKEDADQTVVSEAKGGDDSEEEDVISNDSESAVAPADAEDEADETTDSVSEEALPLTVYLTFDEDADKVSVEVTDNFQADLRKVCNEQGTRFIEFNVEGDLSPLNLRLLLKALK